MVSKQVRVRVQYEFTFDQKQWTEEKKHITELSKDVSTKVTYDPINSFFILKDICYPNVSNIQVKRIS